jgi:hypothetical protein
MDKNIRTVIAPYKAVAFGIIEPFDRTLHVRSLLTGTLAKAPQHFADPMNAVINPICAKFIRRLERVKEQTISFCS